MAEMDFDNAIEWLSGKEDESVYVEVGTKDPTIEIDAVTAPLAMHVTLGGIESASETDKDRLMVVIGLPELQYSRIYLDLAGQKPEGRWDEGSEQIPNSCVGSGGEHWTTRASLSSLISLVEADPLASAGPDS